eukprot:GHVQ01018878.1.p1 GENE.GHVQ01018878.1~~GHVQ01018878.1.p1  ORF type:complete len:543 (-),score=47.68 GHVQ01018878.1:591-2219(-)
MTEVYEEGLSAITQEDNRYKPEPADVYVEQILDIAAICDLAVAQLGVVEACQSLYDGATITVTDMFACRPEIWNYVRQSKIEPPVGFTTEQVIECAEAKSQDLLSKSATGILWREQIPATPKRAGSHFGFTVSDDLLNLVQRKAEEEAAKAAVGGEIPTVSKESHLQTAEAWLFSQAALELSKYVYYRAVTSRLLHAYQEASVHADSLAWAWWYPDRIPTLDEDEKSSLRNGKVPITQTLYDKIVNDPTMRREVDQTMQCAEKTTKSMRGDPPTVGDKLTSLVDNYNALKQATLERRPNMKETAKKGNIKRKSKGNCKGVCTGNCKVESDCKCEAMCDGNCEVQCDGNCLTDKCESGCNCDCTSDCKRRVLPPWMLVSTVPPKSHVTFRRISNTDSANLWGELLAFDMDGNPKEIGGLLRCLNYYRMLLADRLEKGEMVQRPHFVKAPTNIGRFDLPHNSGLGIRDNQLNEYNPKPPKPRSSNITQEEQSSGTNNPPTLYDLVGMNIVDTYVGAILSGDKNAMWQIHKLLDNDYYKRRAGGH